MRGYEKGGAKVGAVEQPARVQVRVLNLQLWMNQSVVKNGVSVETPYTGWIAVTGERKRLYDSNGFFMDAKATERNGVYEVEFKGCAGVGFAKKLTLKAGKSRVVPLFDVIDDASALENVYMAVKAPGGEKADLDSNVGRVDSRVQLLNEGDNVIVDITSKFGIDNATIKRKSNEWPKSILVRLHLGGLESFKAGGEDVAVEWSVSSTGEHAKRVSLRKGREDLALDERSPYHTTVGIVGGNGKLPLKDGYFEVPLPAKLFEGNPKEITLRWIDFYRN